MFAPSHGQYDAANTSDSVQYGQELFLTVHSLCDVPPPDCLQYGLRVFLTVRDLRRPRVRASSSRQMMRQIFAEMDDSPLLIVSSIQKHLFSASPLSARHVRIHHFWLLLRK
jgi:hypothetical protein